MALPSCFVALESVPLLLGAVPRMPGRRSGVAVWAVRDGNIWIDRELRGYKRPSMELESWWWLF